MLNRMVDRKLVAILASRSTKLRQKQVAADSIGLVCTGDRIYRVLYLLLFVCLLLAGNRLMAAGAVDDLLATFPRQWIAVDQVDGQWVIHRWNGADTPSLRFEAGDSGSWQLIHNLGQEDVRYTLIAARRNVKEMQFSVMLPGLVATGSISCCPIDDDRQISVWRFSIPDEREIHFVPEEARDGFPEMVEAPDDNDSDDVGYETQRGVDSGELSVGR